MRSSRGPRWAGAALVAAAVVLMATALLTSHPAPAFAPSRLVQAAHQVAVPTAPRPTVGQPTVRRPTLRQPPASPAKVRPPPPAPSSPAAKPRRLPERDVRPVRIQIRALGIDRRPVPLRVLEDGSLEAPRRYSDVGWWQDGPLPGAGGNAVVVGHLDSETGPAVFYGLASLRRGDLVAVTRRDASTVRFRVRSVQRFRVKDFPAERVYRRGGPSGLVLITCGGRYDRKAGRYLDNVVIFTDRVR